MFLILIFLFIIICIIVEDAGCFATGLAILAVIVGFIAFPPLGISFIILGGIIKGILYWLSD